MSSHDTCHQGPDTYYGRVLRSRQRSGRYEGNHDLPRSTKQSGDWLAVVDAVGTAFAVMDLQVGPHAKAMIDGRHEILRRNGVVARVSGLRIAAAVNLSAANPSSGQDGGLA